MAVCVTLKSMFAAPVVLQNGESPLSVVCSSEMRLLWKTLVCACALLRSS